MLNKHTVLKSHTHLSRRWESWRFKSNKSELINMKQIRLKVYEPKFEIWNALGLLRCNTHISLGRNTFLVSTWKENLLTLIDLLYFWDSFPNKRLFLSEFANKVTVWNKVIMVTENENNYAGTL